MHYPGLEPSAAARAQLARGFGPLLSFELSGSAAQADAVVAAARLVVAVGGDGTLHEVEAAGERRARWAAETAPETRIRLSAGIESVEDRLADIDAALAAAG